MTAESETIILKIVDCVLELGSLSSNGEFNPHNIV